jgi:hypothetical protein
VSFAPVTLRVASQRVLIFVVYFVIDSVRKLFGYILVYLCLPSGILSSDFPTKVLYVFLISPMRAACSTHIFLLAVYLPVQ